MGIIAFLILIIQLQAQKPTTLIPQRIKINSEISVRDSNYIKKAIRQNKRLGLSTKERIL